MAGMNEIPLFSPKRRSSTACHAGSRNFDACRKGGGRGIASGASVRGRDRRFARHSCRVSPLFSYLTEIAQWH
ncbi:hypothetical protein BMAPRL20_0358 [Burkholderia mallei PRL-20]|nr:hypothetical protein BMAGB8_A0405 [Burkholderia mallei GB8 horse 4]EES42474.1 hypothetical protein BMAPRL20_0358 [Burkholderia mallei PRL-20]